LAESLKAAGAPPEVIQKMQAQKPQMPEIQPCNDFIVRLFFKVCTQWVYAGMSGVRVGLNYQAIAAGAESTPGYSELNAELKDMVWSGLQRMEKEVLQHSQSD